MSTIRQRTSLIFVYGTLKRGLCRAPALDGQQFVGEARTQPVYRMVNCGSYPGLLDARPGRSIVGEVWWVDAACLTRLDQIEDIEGGQYARRRVELLPPHDRDIVEAYFYAWPTDGMPDCGECW